MSRTLFLVKRAARMTAIYRVALLGMTIVLSSAVLLLFPAVASGNKPVDDRGAASQGWSFKLDHRSSPWVVVTGRLNYYPHGSAGCFNAFATGNFKKLLGDTGEREVKLWLVGQNCHTGKWVRMLDSSSPRIVGATKPVSGNTMTDVKNVSVWTCSEDETFCTVIDPQCPTCGGKPRGNPKAAEAARKPKKTDACVHTWCPPRSQPIKMPEIPGRR